MHNMQRTGRPDPGLQPERTSLAWLRTLLGYSALLALALRHFWHRAGEYLWLFPGLLIMVAIALYAYARQRRLMDIIVQDFSPKHLIRAKALIALGVLALSLLFVIIHIRQITHHLMIG